LDERFERALKELEEEGVIERVEGDKLRLTDKGVEYAETLLRTRKDAMIFYIYICRKMNKDNNKFLEAVLFTIFKLYGVETEKARELAKAFVVDRVVWKDVA